MSFYSPDREKKDRHFFPNQPPQSFNSRLCFYGPIILIVILVCLYLVLSHTDSLGSAVGSQDPSEAVYGNSLRVDTKDRSYGLNPPVHQYPDFINIPNINSDRMAKVRRLIVIPGGGGGAPKEDPEKEDSKDANGNAGSSSTVVHSNPGYPEWTKRRVIHSSDYFHTLSAEEQEATLFVLLSAGSFNTPNSVQAADQRIIFECQHMIKHLVQMGVSKDHIYGDIFSWDTVTNGLSLRLFVEGLSSFAAHNATHRGHSTLGEDILQVEVFISDFHKKRMETVLRWVLGLRPSLLVDPTTSPDKQFSSFTPKVNLHIHSINSKNIPGLTEAALAERAKHEEKGVAMIRKQAQSITTIQEFYAFIMFGGHLGIRNYLMNDYIKSTGGGW